MILDKKGLGDYQVGKTKIFLRAGQMAELDARRAEVLGNAARVIQRQFRTWIARKKFRSIRNAAIVLQSFIQGEIARTVHKKLIIEAAALRFQKNFRRYIARKSFVTNRSAAIVLQTGFKGMIARNEFRLRRQTKAAIVIQAHWRGQRAYAYYIRLKKAAIITQCAWRCRLARRELRMLKLAARETGALKDAKDKLEKRVEELTWRLQLEKRLRTDLEDAKVLEVAKLQEALHTMRSQLKESTVMVLKEQEAARKAIEEASLVNKEPVVVEDTEKISSLSNEIEKLKGLLSSETHKADEAKQAYRSALVQNEELSKRLDEAGRKINQLQDSVQRFQEKVSNLESENKVLRQQSLAVSPATRALALRPKTTIIQMQRTPERFTFSNGETKQIQEPETEDRPQKSLNQKQLENQELLLKSISEDIGFSEGKPVAACLIYKCLIHWRSFEVERTNIFNRIIETIASAIEMQENDDVLCYWLSNSATLLMLLERTLKAGNVPPSRHRAMSTSLFGRVSQSFIGSPQSVGFPFMNGRAIGGGLDELRQVEAKYPALLFKQQLTAYLEKIYGVIRDRMKREIAPLLAVCIQAPRQPRSGLIKGRSHNNFEAQKAQSAHWQSIVTCLNGHLRTMRANYVPSLLISKVFGQIFSFINVQLFNSLVLRRECCSFSNGEYVKTGLAELEKWCHDATEEFAGLAWDELKHIRQAVGFLVIHQKPKKSLHEITTELCPVLTVQQLYRISTMYSDDKYGTHSVSSEVMASMRQTVSEDTNKSFLLDDDSSIPFSLEDISKSMPNVEVAEIDPPPLIRQNTSFMFLLERSD